MARGAAAWERRPRGSDPAPEARTGRPHCTARNAGSDPHETCGFAAQWVFLRHTHRAGRSRLDSSSWKGESPPSAASCRDPPLRQHGPRSRRANPRRGDHPRHRRPAPPPRVLTGVKAASRTRRPATGGFGLDAGSARAPQRATVRRCRTSTLPHNDRAISASGAPRQRSGAAPSCREGGSAFRLTRKSELARSGAAVTLKGPERSGGPAELAEQVDGRGRPWAPGRRGRPAFILLPSEPPGDGCIDGESEPGRPAAMPFGVEGRSPRQPQCRTLGMLAHDSQRGHEPVFVVLRSCARRLLVTARILVGSPAPSRVRRPARRLICDRDPFPPDTSVRSIEIGEAGFVRSWIVVRTLGCRRLPVVLVRRREVAPGWFARCTRPSRPSAVAAARTGPTARTPPRPCCRRHGPAPPR